MKTDLGKRNFKVTRPDGECSKILVSNPERHYLTIRIKYAPGVEKRVQNKYQQFPSMLCFVAQPIYLMCQLLVGAGGRTLI